MLAPEEAVGVVTPVRAPRPAAASHQRSDPPQGEGQRHGRLEPPSGQASAPRRSRPRRVRQDPPNVRVSAPRRSRPAPRHGADTRTSGQQERTEREGQRQTASADRTESRQQGQTERTEARQQGQTERTDARSNAAQNINANNNWDNHYDYHDDDDEWGYALAGAAVGATVGYMAGAASTPTYVSPTYVTVLPCSPTVVATGGVSYYGCGGSWYNQGIRERKRHLCHRQRASWLLGLLVHRVAGKDVLRMTWPIFQNRLKGMILLAGILLAVGCAGPISVERVDHATVHQELTRNVLSARTLSDQTRNVLRQWSLTDRFQERPEYAIADLHAAVAEGRGQANEVFALAEMSFLYAEEHGERPYYLASALYAYAFLFPGTAGQPPDPYDPRLRLASDLYNRGLTSGLETDDGKRSPSSRRATRCRSASSMSLSTLGSLSGAAAN